jgi:predicted DNA-binding protein
MGRPPLNVKETKVRLTDEQRQRIEALVGKSRMATFIREAIDRELERREAGAAQPPKKAE